MITVASLPGVVFSRRGGLIDIDEAPERACFTDVFVREATKEGEVDGGVMTLRAANMTVRYQLTGRHPILPDQWWGTRLP